MPLACLPPPLGSTKTATVYQTILNNMTTPAQSGAVHARFQRTLLKPANNFLTSKLCRYAADIINSNVAFMSSEFTIGTAFKARPKILIAHSEIPKTAFEVFENKCDLIISKGDPYPSRQTLLKDIQGVDGALWFGHVKVDKEMLDAAGGQLKVVGVASAGYDHVDVRLLKERNIKVSNTPGTLSCAVADMAVGLALAVSRNILQGNTAVRENKWVVNHPTWMCGPALEGATVGIIGMGDIGCKIAQRMKSFDIGQLLYSNRHQRSEAADLGAKFVSLDELLVQSDFVFVMVPLTPDTKHLFNMDKFKKMKPTSIFINTSRGDVVNQEDLLEAIKKNIIWGAGLDVTSPEPLPHDHPLLSTPHVVITPHISSATLKTREAMAKLAAHNIWNALNGKEMLTPIK